MQIRMVAGSRKLLTEKCGTRCFFKLLPVAISFRRCFKDVGRVITLDGRSFTIVGVLPPRFRSLDKTDVIEPIGTWATINSDYLTDRGARGEMVVVGRLAPGASLARARTEMNGIAARLAKDYPLTNDQFGVSAELIRDAFVGDIRPAILVLFGAAGFVMLIACANVANLFLVRGTTRAKEVALRVAFSASRGRIVRQMLTESLVVASLGGILGLALGIGILHSIASVIPRPVLQGMDVHLDGAVLLFVGAITSRSRTKARMMAMCI